MSQAPKGHNYKDIRDKLFATASLKNEPLLNMNTKMYNDVFVL